MSLFYVKLQVQNRRWCKRNNVRVCIVSVFYKIHIFGMEFCWIWKCSFDPEWILVALWAKPDLDQDASKQRSSLYNCRKNWNHILCCFLFSQLLNTRQPNPESLCQKISHRTFYSENHEISISISQRRSPWVQAACSRSLLRWIEVGFSINQVWLMFLDLWRLEDTV